MGVQDIWLSGRIFRACVQRLGAGADSGFVPAKVLPDGL